MSTRARRRARHPSGRRAAALTLAVLLVPAALAGCTGDDEGPGPSATAAPAPDATPSVPATPVPGSPAPGGGPTGPATVPPPSPGPTVTVPAGGTEDDAPATEVPFPADTSVDTSVDTADPAGEARLGLVDVRVGAHVGYDRVVLDLAGTGTPGWRAGYTADPREDGSGAPVAVAGGAVLGVVVSGTTYPGESGVPPYSGPARLTPTGTGAVVEVVHGVVFEGLTSVWVGVDERRPFRVFALADPPRVVVDVRTG
ncbi:AMIN-like domain-containing (lipo)protein [Cellulomonas endophytica]|uniref:AMIN-like domain-containing (lipo)protein n=1 Tax=Cellulomonas endophytica TaxID=2494735 RepID=UPI0010137F02|nr:hypothetical protein [Cellulomonas endophytica]